MPRYKFTRKDVLSQEEVRSMIEQTGDASFKAFIAFLYLFGCRVSEALAVEVKDVELGKANLKVWITVLKRKEKGPLRFRHPVVVSRKSPFADHFLAHLGMVSQGKLWPFNRVTAWRRIKKLNSQCSPHIFRHTRATRLASKTTNPYELVDYFGWANMNEALNYVHLSGRLASRLSDKVD